MRSNVGIMVFVLIVGNLGLASIWIRKAVECMKTEKGTGVALVIM